jgi:MtN3 and saliva related transmembrane protein
MMESNRPDLTAVQSREEIFSNSNSFVKYYEKYMVLIGSVGQLLFYLQAYRIWVKKSTGAVSTTGFVIAFVSILSWLIYGIIINNQVLIKVNGVGLLGAVLTLISIVIVHFNLF